MDTNIAYGLMIATLGVFGYIGYQASNAKEIEADEYLSARGSQNLVRNERSHDWEPEEERQTRVQIFSAFAATYPI